MSRFDRAVLLITTVCDRACPHCCYGLPGNPALPPAHATLAALEAAAPHLRGLAWLGLSGGEPTLHPDFDRIARAARRLFRPKVLALATNGARVVAHGAAMAAFDEVRVTTFGESADRAAVAWLVENLPGRYRPASADHRPMRGRPGQACRRDRTVAWAAGRLYPCCVAPGLPGARSVPVTPDWRAQLARLPLPCAACPFTVP